MDTLEFTVETVGERLDKLIVAHINQLSRTQVQTMIKEGAVTVNGNSTKAGVKLRGGERIVVILPKMEEETEILPEDIDLTIIYEDEEIAVIDKPAGMVMHPGKGHEKGTLVNALIGHWPQIATMNDPDHRKGVVHRLDKDTSGLLVIAKNEDVLVDLMVQFQSRTVEKTYIALLERTPQSTSGRIEAPIGRDPNHRKRMAVIRDGKEAITVFRIIDDDFTNGQALVEFDLFTGRTHQIRVHAAFIGCPVVGDRVYGFRKQRTRMRRNFLHAAKLVFDHPASGQRLQFTSALPTNLLEIMRKLR